MALLIRRGAYSNFVPSKLRAGEFADVQSGDPNSTDGKGVYICLTNGSADRLARSSEVTNVNTEAQAYANSANQSATSASASATSASASATSAAASAQQAQTQAERAIAYKPVLTAQGIITYQAETT